jgi:hypothetical protein
MVKKSTERSVDFTKFIAIFFGFFCISFPLKIVTMNKFSGAYNSNARFHSPQNAVTMPVMQEVVGGC